MIAEFLCIHMLTFHILSDVFRLLLGNFVISP